jgi:chemotaxis signal transduction protein
MKEIKFLGHTISQEGIAIDPDKVQEVMNWKPPSIVRQIWSFLGLAGIIVDSFQISPELLSP